MRKIKVRVWNTEWKMMMMPKNITNILTDPEGMYGVEFYITVTQSHNEKTQEKDMWEEDCVFMQYTGLKDKNGKEIYEGDIVQYKDKGNITDDFIEVVKWDEDRGCFCTKGSEYVWGEVSRLSKVIGNIYENPELLQVAK